MPRPMKTGNSIINTVGLVRFRTERVLKALALKKDPASGEGGASDGFTVTSNDTHVRAHPHRSGRLEAVAIWDESLSTKGEPMVEIAGSDGSPIRVHPMKPIDADVGAHEATAPISQMQQ